MKPIPKRRLIPIITDLIEYRQAANNTIYYTKKKVEKYGEVCECSFTGIKNYFIHDPEIIEKILTTLGPKMKRTYFFRAFSKFLGQGLFTSDGKHHKQQRKLIKPAFYPARIEEYANIMKVKDELDKVVNGIIPSYRKDGNGKKWIRGLPDYLLNIRKLELISSPSLKYYQFTKIIK